jgi:hypothetical protein
MPKYLFLNLETDELEEYTLRISEYDAFKESNPTLQRYIDSAPKLSYNGTGDFGNKKPDNTWNEVLSKVAEQNPRSELANRVRRRSAKEVKTDQVIEKHNKLQAERKNPNKRPPRITTT